MLLDEPISFNQEELTDNYTPIPMGMYRALIHKCEAKSTRTGGTMLALEWRIQGPTHTGRVIFHNINIKNQNEVAQRIGRKELAKIADIKGLSTITDTDQLIGITADVFVIITDPDRWNPMGRNEIKKIYKPSDKTPVLPQPGKLEQLPNWGPPSNGYTPPPSNKKTPIPWD